MADDRADLRLFRVVHLAFRATGKEIADAFPGLDNADTERVAGVADVWDFYARALSHHHENEDDVIWPRIVERRPDFADVEAEMKREHRDVDTALTSATQAVTALRGSADPAAIKAASDAVAMLVRELDEHLDHEERVALPIVHEAFGREEFEKMEEQFLRSTARGDLPYEAASLDEWARRVPDAERPPPPPLPVRLMLALSWRRKYRRFVEPIREAG
jgi:hemerythrin-like domain-containing protein